MQFSVSTCGEKALVTIQGAFDANSAPGVRGQLDAIVDAKPAHVEVDLSSLRLIDSTGVGGIVSLFKRTRAYGGQFNVIGVQGQPLSIFRLLRLDRVFGLPEARN
jgi:anti-sigma B factor antagonist